MHSERTLSKAASQPHRKYQNVGLGYIDNVKVLLVRVESSLEEASAPYYNREYERD